MESIYNLVPEEYDPVKFGDKGPMYRSRYDPKAGVTGIRSTPTVLRRCWAPGKRKASGTMGRRTERPDPNDYLKGQTKCKKVSSRVDVQKFDRPIGTRKEPVPRPHERPVLGLHTAKNFVTANAVEAILQVPAVRYSEEPDYMAKQDYGKVPAYLSQVKEEIKRENEMIDQYVQEQMGLAGHAVEDPGVEMDPEERQQIILALKKKWDHTNRQYQLCTHKVDFPSFGDKARKRGLEER